jgi:putative membrane protein (TIGR04086 family)
MDSNQLSRGSPRGPVEPRGFFTGVKILPIIVGAVVDYVATFVVVMAYLIIYYVKEPLESGGLPEEVIERAFKEMVSSQEGLVALLVIGALCTVLGGYVAGRLAKAQEVKHGALVGAVSLVLGALQSGMVGEETPIPQWVQLLGYILAIPAGALGGWLAAIRPRAPLFGAAKNRGP